MHTVRTRRGHGENDKLELMRTDSSVPGRAGPGIDPV